jgi:hypothetical protein
MRIAAYTLQACSSLFRTIGVFLPLTPLSLFVSYAPHCLKKKIEPITLLGWLDPDGSGIFISYLRRIINSVCYFASKVRMRSFVHVLGISMDAFNISISTCHGVYTSN